MRLTKTRIELEQHRNEFVYIPKHLLHDKTYKNIGALEVFMYAFMVDFSYRTDNGFLCDKKYKIVIKKILGMTDSQFNRTLKRLKENHLVKEFTLSSDCYFIKDIYLPVTETECAVYYG